MSATNRHGELVEIRHELRTNRFYLDDPVLREQVNEWIDESHEMSDADTAREYIEQKLNGMLAENEMYFAPGIDRPEDAFPNECEDCRHYGSSCPVLRDRIQSEWRERRLEQADSEHEARQIYQQQAIDVNCIVIPELLNDWDTLHADFVRRGERLLGKLEESIKADSIEDVDTEMEPVGAEPIPESGS